MLAAVHPYGADVTRLTPEGNHIVFRPETIGTLQQGKDDPTIFIGGIVKGSIAAVVKDMYIQVCIGLESLVANS